MRNKIMLILSLVAFPILLNSCLKDDRGENWTDALKGKMYAEIEYPGFWAYTITPDSAPQNYHFLVNIATDVPPTHDVTITLGSDQAALDAYNQAQYALDSTFQFYKMMPSWNFGNNTVTIKAGTRNAYVNVWVNRADTLDLSSKYMVPVSIESVSDKNITIAANKKTILIAMPIANQYEGSYSDDGRIFREDAAWDRTYSSTKYLSTVNANTVHLYLADIGWDVYLSVDPITNEVSYSVPAGNTPVLANTLITNYQGVGGDSHYDPATRTFYLYWYYVGGGNVKRIGYDVLVRQ